MSTYTISAPPSYKEVSALPDKRKPAVLPQPKPDEKVHDWALRLIEDCPCENVTIFGFNIPKFMQDPDSFLMKNRGVPFPLRILRRELSQSQVEAIWERAKITPIHRDAKPDPEDGKKMLPEINGWASDWLIIKRVEPETQAADLPGIHNRLYGENDGIPEDEALKGEILDQLTGDPSGGAELAEGKKPKKGKK